MWGFTGNSLKVTNIIQNVPNCFCICLCDCNYVGKEFCTLHMTWYSKNASKHSINMNIEPFDSIRIHLIFCRDYAFAYIMVRDSFDSISLVYYNMHGISLCRSKHDEVNNMAMILHFVILLQETSDRYSNSCHFNYSENLCINSNWSYWVRSLSIGTAIVRLLNI